MGRRVHYESYIESPEMAAVCLGCTEDSCDGICDRYRNAYRLHIGLSPLPNYMAQKKRQAVRANKPEKKSYVHKKMLSANGEAHTLKEWAKLTGIPYNTLYMRMYRRGMGIDEAIQYGQRMKFSLRRQITVRGETKSLAEWAEEKGLSTRCILKRLDLGYSDEEAVLTPRGGKLV